MLAVPASVAGQNASGARPTQLNNDSGQILGLLDMAFGPLPAGRGQRMLINPAGSNLGSMVGLRFGDFYQGIVPGFVWEEDGRIVGTMSLLAARKSGKYLIANVAVHPEYRRRGIATGLMSASMEYIRRRGGREILLQVERDNEPANRLYQDLSFKSLGEVNHWETNSVRVRSVTTSHSEGVNIRPLSGKDERAAYSLDRRCMPFNLRWPDPPNPKKYELTLWRRVSNFFNGRKLNVWVADIPTDKPRTRRLVGLAYIESEWARPHEMAIRVTDVWRGRLERSLLANLVAQIKQDRTGRIRITHLASDEEMNDLLGEANFRVKRSLRLLHYKLDGND